MAFNLYYHARNRFRLVDAADKSLRRFWYRYFSSAAAGRAIHFINLGYVDIPSSDPEPHLLALDEPDRPSARLYDRVVAPVSLRGKSVLEIGCGHGGGSAFIHRVHQPREMVGVDRNEAAIDRCRESFSSEGLLFRPGDAEALPFEPERFDAVVNIESSHCYQRPGLFFKEVHRVLRPGGDFLFADFRPREERQQLEGQLTAAGLATVSIMDISRNVVQAMELMSAERRRLAEALLPRVLARAGGQFAGVAGSHIHRQLAGGETVYLHLHLRRPK